jgi:phage gpG-like protein
MPNDLKIIVGGNAIPIIAAAGARSRGELAQLAVTVATEVQRQAKLNVREVLNTTGRSTGNLRRGITVIPHKSALEAEVGPQAVYGAIHEFGGTIKAKNKPYLCFQVVGAQSVATHRATQMSWVRVKEVTIPKRPYLKPALDKVEPRIPEIVSAQLLKLLGG